MLKTIMQASENFCIHQIRLPYEINNGISQKRTIIAYVDINKLDNIKYRVYLACDVNFMQRILKLFLEEDKSNEEDLINMTLETTNMIIGSAKVIADDENENPYTFSIPKFEKIDNFDYTYDEAKIIKIEEDEMMIAIRKTNV